MQGIGPGRLEGAQGGPEEPRVTADKAQQQGQLDASLPPELVLYTVFARACDPVVSFLKESGQYSDEEIVELVVRTCFEGLAARA